jgi:protein-tyrosine-phosphatase
VEKQTPIACAKRLGGPGTRRGGPRRGATTLVASWPSGLSVGPVSTRAQKPYASGTNIQGLRRPNAATHITTTPPATTRAATSLTGFGKPKNLLAPLALDAMGDPLPSPGFQLLATLPVPPVRGMPPKGYRIGQDFRPSRPPVGEEPGPKRFRGSTPATTLGYRQPAVADRPHVLVLCTGNAARSVMAGALLDQRGIDARITTAGTHVVEHQPMSRRTRDALTAIGVQVPEHRSRQIAESDVESADLVIAMASDHVHYVRRRHPSAAPRTATLCWLAAHLRAGDQSLPQRVAELDLAKVEPDVQGDVPDPAGGDDAEYVDCARTIKDLVDQLAERLNV